MRILTKEQILQFHRELINAHGGTDGICDEGLLESALRNKIYMSKKSIFI